MLFFLSISKVLDKIVAMSKRKSSMDIDDVRNDINKWLDDSDDEVEGDLNEVNGDEENEEILSSERNVSR